jgi:anti-anti-sigma factor
MEFHRHQTRPEIMVLVADHGLDTYDSRPLIDDLMRSMDAGTQTLVVDCAQLRHVGTIAVCALVTLHRRLAVAGMELRLAAVQAPLWHVLTITRLDQVFHVFPSVEDAERAPAQPAATLSRPAH